MGLQRNPSKISRMNVNISHEQVQTLLKNASADTLRKILSYLVGYYGDNYDSTGANIISALIAMPSDKLTPELIATANKYVGDHLGADESVNYINYNPIINCVKYEIVDTTNDSVKYTSYICL